MGRKKKEPGDIPPVDKSESFGDDTAIVTYEDLQKEKPVENLNEKIKQKKKKPVIDIKFECSFASMGDSKTMIQYKLGDKLVTKEIIMHNKLYDFPKDLTKEESKVLRKALKENGFFDVTVIEGAKFDKEKKEYVYSAMHPDHSKQDPFNANISLPILDEASRVICGPDGKQIFKQVAVVNGLVKTDDKRIYQALIKAGFKSCFAQEKVEV